MPEATWQVLDWRRQVAALYTAVRSEADPRQGHALWATARDQLLRTHPASPVPAQDRGRFGGVPVAPYDPDFRFVLPIDPPIVPARRRVPTGTDGVVELDCIGHVMLPDLGCLDLWWVTGYGGGLFLPIRDATSGRSTYGGGRYVLDTAKGADLGGSRDALVIDLNFAYMPSCALDEGWACPLPDAGNTLMVPVPVGELWPARPSSSIDQIS